jgi:hypothetical protein
MRASVSFVLGVVLVSGSGVARAEATRAGHVVNLPTVKVSGRVQTPLASVEVSRAEPKLTLSELRPTFADRIDRALAHDPY